MGVLPENNTGSALAAKAGRHRRIHSERPILCLSLCKVIKHGFPFFARMDGWKLLAGFFALFVVSVLAILAVTGVADASCVSVLSLQGEISFSEPSFFSSVPSARTCISSIEKWDASSSPVLLLEVDSPGGGAVASKELYDALRSVKKPVVAYLGEVAASGGYYAASATQYIVANPNTLTGRLGARAEILNYEQLFQKIGLRSESVQSGRLKDIGAGYRNMTPEERSILQGIIDELKGNFQKDVETARAGKLTPQFQTVLDSRV